MAVVTKLWLESMPDATEVGGRPTTYNGIYHVQLDERVPAGVALQMCRQYKSTPPSPILGAPTDGYMNGVHRDTILDTTNDIETAVPWRGQSLSLTSQKNVPVDITPDPTFSRWVLRNDHAYAMDFDCRAKSTVDNMFEVIVTWRPPVIGQDEMPSAIFSFPYSPLGRAADVWFEFQSLQEMVNQGYQVPSYPNGQADMELKPITARNGEPVWTQSQPSETWNVPTLICEFNVNGADYSYRKNQELSRTLNQNAVKSIPPTSVTFPPNTLKFLRCRQSRLYSLGWGDVYRVRMEYLVDPKFFWTVRFANVGNNVRIETSPGEYKLAKPLDEKGHALTGPFQLDGNGELSTGATPVDEFWVNYRTSAPADYLLPEPVVPAEHTLVLVTP